MPSHYGKKSPAKHTGKGKGNHLDSQTHGKEISFHRHKNLGGGQYKDNWTVIMDKKPATEYAPFKMKSPIKDASTGDHPHQHLKMKRELASITKNSGGEIKAKKSERVAQYAPFKMKGHTLPGINQRTGETNSSAFQLVDDIKNPVAGASPMQKPLVGKQKNLPEHLKKEILAAPAKQLDDKKQDFEPFYEGGDYSREQLEAMSKKELKSLFPDTHKKIIKDLRKAKKKK
jgi:hypothetical protein